jgi:hypothetical protein
MVGNGRESFNKVCRPRQAPSWDELGRSFDKRMLMAFERQESKFLALFFGRWFLFQ